MAAAGMPLDALPEVLRRAASVRHPLASILEFLSEIGVPLKFLQGRQIELILSESEKSAAQQPSSSGTSLAVRYLYYAGCNTGLMTPDQLERLLICSAKHNGEHTAELIAALRDAGCKTIAHLSLDQAYDILMASATSDCRTGQLQEVRRRLEPLLKRTARGSVLRRDLEALLKPYPAGCATGYVVKELVDSGCNLAALSSEQIVSVLTSHAKRASPYTSHVIGELIASGFDCSKRLSPEQKRAIHESIDENDRRYVIQLIPV